MNTKEQNYFTLLVFLVAFFIMPGIIPVYSLDPTRKVTQYIHEMWGIEQNLPQNTVEAIIQDKKGYLWLGTQGGLVRFDGVRFTVFHKGNVAQLLHNWVRDILEDHSGNLWIATYGGGLTHLNQTTGVFTTFTKANGLSDNLVLCLYEDREGSLWIGTDGVGLNVLKAGKFIPSITRQGLSSDRITSIGRDRGGTLWIGTEAGLKHYTNGKFFTYSTQEGMSDNRITSIYIEPDGDLWIGTRRGLDHLDPKTGRFTVFTTGNGLSSNLVKIIHEDRQGNLWIGTQGGGLCRLRNGEFSAFTTREGLSADSVMSIYEDREGSLWVGTQGGGLSRLKDGKFVTYTTREGLVHAMVRSIYEDEQGYIWIGTYGGLNRLDPRKGTFTTITSRDGLSNDLVRCVYKDKKGNLWAGTEGGGLNLLNFSGVGKITSTTFTRKDGLANDTIWALYEDRQGNLWIGTNGGLNRLQHLDPDSKPAIFTTYTREHGLSSNIVKSLCEDRKGNLWIGTEAGLNYLENGKFKVYTTADGLSSHIIRIIHEDSEGVLWIGTREGGLNRFKNGKFTPFTTKNGLFDDIAFGILEDDGGNLWMWCNRGIYRVSKRQLNEVAEGKRQTLHCVSYDEKDGMRSREVNGSSQPLGWKSRDGRLWFPTIKGAVVIDPLHIPINPRPPAVVIETIAAENTTVEPPFLPKGENLVFSPGNERWEIHYTALSLLVPERVQFKYRLEGYDKQWIEVGTRRTAYYTGLPPGKYNFRVKACNNDGTWNETGASVSFYVKPYFYQAWWFYSLGVLGVFLLALGIYRLRVRQLTRHKLELERLVAERTHDLEKSNKELEKLSIVARETDNAIAVMDEKGNIQWLNEGFTRMYDYTLEQLIKEKGGNIAEVSSNPNIREVFAEFLRAPKTISYEVLFQKRSGKQIWSQTTLTPIFNESGKLIKIVAIDTDISKVKESEQQIQEKNQRILRQRQDLEVAYEVARREREAAKAANQAKSEFLAHMSHEIRTPMNGVIGFADMLLDTDLSEEQLDYIQTIRHSGEALIQLLNDILDLSKIEAGELSIVSIDFDPELTVFDVSELILPRLRGKPVEMLYRIGNNVPAFVKGDPGRFRQVLINLLGNAVKFTNLGEIELSVQVEEEKDNRVKFHVKVRDTGIGIPQDKLGIIFDPFQQADGSTTRSHEGAGLGLTISKQIANLLGGEVWAESTPGKGSTFHFTAWMSKSEKEPGKKKENKAHLLTGRKALETKSPGVKSLENVYQDNAEILASPTITEEAKPPLRILLAEDNPINQKLASYMLTKAGYRLTMVKNGKEAVEAITSEPGEYDLIFMDIRMPQMDGMEAARLIREKGFKNIPIIAMTAQSMKGDREKCLEVGMNDYISKPIKKDEVFAMAQKWCPDTVNSGDVRWPGDE